MGKERLPRGTIDGRASWGTRIENAFAAVFDWRAGITPGAPKPSAESIHGSCRSKGDSIS